MVETILKIKNNGSYDESAHRLKPPIPPEFFTSECGIPFNCITDESWIRDDNGNLLEVKVTFSYDDN